MYIVCITACPAGVAHTYLAAKALEMAGEELGVEVKVETQSIDGIENEITTDDIERADGAIFATEIAIEGEERFEDLPVLRCSVSEPIEDGLGLIKELIGAVEEMEL